MEFLKLFQNHSQYEEFAGGGGMPRPNVSHCINENEVHYNPFSWAKEYLTFVALEDGEFGFAPRNGYAISYSIDNGKTWEVPSSATHPTVSAGSKVMWKSADITNTTNSTNGGLLKAHKAGIGTFTSTGHFEVKGNIMSLISGDSFANADKLIKGKEFHSLFQGCTGLTSAENLILPATTMADGDYSSMFYGCTSLTTAPELPATTLTNGCYSSMFGGCTSLTTAPELPATTLAGSCYYGMFNGCTSLNYIKAMFTTTPSGSSPNYYTANWVDGVAASGTFVKNSAAEWDVSGVNGIPEGWTVQTA